MKKQTIAAYITAGGKSRRFKEDKSLYVYQNKPLIEHVYDTISNVFDKITIITEEPDKYTFLNCPVISDHIHGLGPISGLHTALLDSNQDSVFLFPCDTPFLNQNFIEYMINESDDSDITVPVINGYYEPLHAIYSKSCLRHVVESINNMNYKIFSFFEKVTVKKIDETAIREFSNPDIVFKNINFKSDIENL